jgi:mRNA interferase RelE/StbE
MPPCDIGKTNSEICITTERAGTGLEGIPVKFRKQIVNKINGLAADSRPPGSRIVHRAMDGERTIYRIRSGDYRVLYSIRDDAVIEVLDIGHRKDVYR